MFSYYPVLQNLLVFCKKLPEACGLLKDSRKKNKFAFFRNTPQPYFNLNKQTKKKSMSLVSRSAAHTPAVLRSDILHNHSSAQLEYSWYQIAFPYGILYLCAL